MRTLSRSLTLTLFALIFVLSVGSARAQYPAKCDGDKECIGNALTIKITSGKGAQYVDIDTSYRLRDLSTAITFEAWIAPQQQPGKIQYIGGLWGPNRDNNDQWVLYVQDTRVVFALSADNSYKGDSDNTIAIANVPDLYTRGWVHVAGVWDGASTAARIYIDGVLSATATNPLYPITHLHPTENKLLPTQIGSTNALYDDTLTHRAFRGQIDEIRLWDRALTQQEIQCQRLLSLAGNEPGLEMYFRCNETPATQTLCDATGHNHIGRMRSGALCDSSDRTMPPTFTVTPNLVTAKLTCTEDTTLSFSIVDTSICGDNVALSMYGADAGLFTISTSQLTLVQGVQQTFTARLQARLIGPISAGIAVTNLNRCGDPVYIPINLNRTTELNYSIGKLDLDTLIVGCQDKTYSDGTITICNPTQRTITVSNISTDSNHFSWTSPGLTFPKLLAPGDCITVTVRMDMLDTSKTLLDTLRIASDEACAGAGIIPISGRVQDVLGLLMPNGITRFDSMHFEEVCPGMISNPQTYQYRSLGTDTVRIDTITFSKNFYGFQFNFPLTLLPKQAYFPTFVRFRPDAPGPFSGTITFYARYRDCRIIKHAYLTGRGYSVDVMFQQPSVNFGNVTIGKTAQLTTSVYDSGADPRQINSYLKIGDVFTITSGKSFGITPGQTQSIGLQFRPRQPITYFDTLAIFDEGCYETRMIPISGTGVFKDLEFTPPYLTLPNVVGCQSAEGTIDVKNISGGGLTIVSSVLNDPSGKFTLQNNLPSGPFANDQSFTFTLTYTPNDLTTDRTDEAYIDITLSDGQIYHILLRATSAAPRLYVTPLTTYGTVEVGWQKRDSILIENASAVREKITSITLPYGFNLISTSQALPVTLDPRDSLWAVVEFKPTGDSDYTGNLIAQVDSPCTVAYTGVVTGRGDAVKLEVPVSFMNYGLVKPCDCAVREIPLGNYSNLIPITIDSIWIDGTGVTPLVPSTFNWRRQSTGGTALPFTLAPGEVDTILIAFCPNIPATKANLIKNDTLHISAHTPGWSTTFRTMLSGRREMNFQPNVSSIAFPATRVDTSAQPQTVTLTVPDITINPSADSIIITDVSFKPDQRVFTAQAATGVPLPWVVKRNQKFGIKVNFFPRAPKTYTARMQIHTTYPCDNVDTTVLVTGTGFAPAFGLQAAFDTAKVGRDTILLTTCDTLVLPIMTSRAIPQKYIDMYFHLGYDTSSFELLGCSSPFTSDVVATDTSDGANVVLRNGVDVQAGTVAYVKLKVKGGPNAFPITLDDINFDSDSLVFFKIIAGIDHGVVQIDQPMIAVTKLTAFDTVNIKSCKDEIVTVSNPGLLPIRFDSLAGLPRWHQVTASSVPLPAMLAPGDSLQLTVTFCPRDEVLFDTTIASWSNMPCPIVDTGRLTSFGYAPPFPFKMYMMPDVAAIDSVGGRIADTVEVPILVDRDIPQTPLDMKFELNYNPRALEFLGVTSSYTTPVAADSIGTLGIVLPGTNSVAKGEIARVKFLIAVPDSIVSTLTLVPQKFTSDSIFWVKPRPVGDTSTVRVQARCNITRLNFTGGTNSMSVPTPNPTSGVVALDVEFVGDADAELRVFNASGENVLTLLDGKSMMKSGAYHLQFDSRSLASGAYWIRFVAGDFKKTERIIVIK